MTTPPTHPPLHLLRAPALTALPWLRHGFSTRAAGVTTIYGRPNDLNLGFTKEDDPAAVQENRRRLVSATQSPGPLSPWPLITTRQVHAATTLTLHEPPAAPLPPADGLTTQIPGHFLAMLTADCVPVLLVDPIHRAIAVFHAGWRGTAARIVEQGVEVMRTQHRSDPTHLLAAIGSSIGPCCYAVGEETTQAFHEAFPYAPDLFSDGKLDLWQANRRQLLTAGVPATNITVLAQCTACTRDDQGRREFFSHRAERGVTGRMISLIAIQPGTHPVP